MPVLQVRDLTIDVALERSGRAEVVSEVSFSVEPGNIVGLFGESGCGKTTLALALTGLLPDRYRARGSVILAGRELLGLPEGELERVRGVQIALMFQDPLLALNPVMRAGEQVAETMRAHGRPAAGSRREAVALLRRVGLADSARIGARYPHQLSGGERQRVLLAQALACGPALVVADEPFTALDAPRVVEIAALFQDLAHATGTSFLVISHSPGVLARIAGLVLVMYAGRIVEAGTPQQVFESPLHPYTAALLRSVPPLSRGDAPLPAIPGAAPAVGRRPAGCAFQPRCDAALASCSDATPAASAAEDGRLLRCVRYAG